MPELLAPAFSPEAVIAAIQNGADAIYFNYGGLVPKSRSYHFTKDEFGYAAEYCRVRGVKLYVDLTGLVPDESFPRLAAVIKSAVELGADGLILDDLGALRAARAMVPTVPLHAGPRLAVHNPQGARVLGELGFSRVAIYPLLDRQEIARIARTAGVETEICVQGSLCPALPGSCLLSAYQSGAGESRGLCSRPCLEDYVFNKNSAPHLSMEDLCLAGRVEDFEKCAVTALRIDGASRRPEYVALFTGLYARALKSGRAPDPEELVQLRQALGLKASTQAPFMGEKDANLFGAKSPQPPDDNLVLAEARQKYLRGEYQRVALTFAAVVRAGAPIRLAAEDDRGLIVTVEGPSPTSARDNPITYARLKTLFYRTEGTPFLFGSMRVALDEGLELPSSVLNELLHQLLDKMAEARRARPLPPVEEFHPGLKYMNPKTPPLLTVSVSRAEQLSEDLAGMKPALLYLPLRLAVENPRLLLPFWDNDYTDIVPVLPALIRPGQMGELRRQLSVARKLNIQDIAIQNIGHLPMAAEAGFRIHGDTGLNVFNSQTMRSLKELGLVSAALSYELSFKQVRELSKAVDTELVVYGRLPLMTTGLCIIKAAGDRCVCENPAELLDKRGAAYPLLPAENCGNLLLSPGKLFFGNSRRVYYNLGLWAVRLNFTTENAAECIQVMERYLGRGHYEPRGKTRGLYPRGVE